MNNYFPINLNLKDKKCFVIGGGNVAERKVFSLLECEAEIKVVSHEFTPELIDLAFENKIICFERSFEIDDLNDVFLVICATNDEKLNNQIACECEKRNILVNVVDDPEKCNFLVPAILRQGSLGISISTSGISPTLSRKIKEDLAEYFGPEYAEFLEIMRDIRYNVIAKCKDAEKRKRVFESLVYSDILNLIKNKENQQIEERIKQCLSLI